MQGMGLMPRTEAQAREDQRDLYRRFELFIKEELAVLKTDVQKEILGYAHGLTHNAHDIGRLSEIEKGE